MGWNDLDVVRDHPLVDGVDGEYAYFVHSYYAELESDDHAVTETEYGTRFPSIVANDEGNVFGTQFHPRSPARPDSRFSATSSTSAPSSRMSDASVRRYRPDDAERSAKGP